MRRSALFCTLFATAAAIAPMPGTMIPVRADEPPALSPEKIEKADELREELRGIIDIARDRVFPALVNIHVSTVDYWGGKERKGAATGSGTIISPEGYVITNQHVTNKGKKFKCTLSDRQEISAEMVGEDPLTDLAVIKLDLSELKSPSTPLPTAVFGDSNELRVGDYVMAMGSPFSLSRSVTLGIASNVERVFTGRGSNEVEEMELDSGQSTGLFTRWIQHDALIHPGNSGGPLVNLKGEIIGVNELGGNGMGFAIPGNLAKQVARALIEHGEVVRSWIGISIKPIAKTGFESGLLVNSVVSDGPAAKAGIKPGDNILRIAGEAVTIRFAEQIPPLMKKVADLPVGSELKITYQRDGQMHEASVTTEKLEKDTGDEASLRSWGITCAEITRKMARQMQLADASGMMISGVRSGGPAAIAEPALEYGDIIRKIEGEPIADLKAGAEAYEKVMESDPLPEWVLVEFDRQGKNHVTLVKPKPDEMEDSPREIRKAWIGIATQPVLDKLARKMGLSGDTGFRITRVYPHTRAVASELKVGDIIIALNGNPLRPKGMQDAGMLMREVKKLDLGDEATITVLRDGESHDIAVSLEATQITAGEARRAENRDFEITVREITFFDRDDMQWSPDVKGVMVEQVEPGGWAGRGGLRSGDLIQKINGKRVSGPKGFKKVMAKIAKEQPERVVFVVLRGIETRFQFVEPEWKPEVDTQERASEDTSASADKTDQPPKEQD